MSSRPASPSGFLGALCAHWLTAMSGPLSVPFAVAGVFVTNDVARVLLFLAAFLCIWLAAYAVWRREHEHVIKLEEEVAAATAHIPPEDFKGDFDETKHRRAELRGLAEKEYDQSHDENFSPKVWGLLAATPMPALVPGVSPYEWLNRRLSELNAEQRGLLAFTSRILGGVEGDKLRLDVAKFWDRWGRRIMEERLDFEKVRSIVDGSKHELKLVAFLELAHAQKSGWDTGSGKIGLFYLAAKANWP